MYGKAWTKFVVPSIGSTMNVGAGVKREDEGVGEDSSPRNLGTDVRLIASLGAQPL